VSGVAADVQNVGLTWRIREGMAARYDRDHATIWPELEQRLRALGVSGFSIFRRGDTVFAHLVVADYARFTSDYAVDQVALEWERQWDDVLIVDNPDPGTGWPERLVHVWTL
jgi:L-rhamnose mutarotase